MKSTINRIRNKNGKIYKAYKFVMDLSDKIDEHHLYLLSAGIAFNILLYIIPIFLVATFVVSSFIDVQHLSATIEEMLMDFLPPTASSLEIVRQIITEVQNISAHSTAAGWIGLATLLWVSSALLSSLRTGLNAIFQISETKNFVFYRLKDILLTITISILILLYSYAVPLLNFIISMLNQFIPDFIQEYFSSVLVTVSSLFTSFTLFYFIYSFVPTKRLPKWVTIYSTLSCVLLIELTRHVFAWYISGISNYGKLYGTYAVIVSMALWIYYSALIILLSAEAVKFIHDRKKQNKVQVQTKPAPINRKVKK